MYNSLSVCYLQCSLHRVSLLFKKKKKKRHAQALPRLLTLWLAVGPSGTTPQERTGEGRTKAVTEPRGWIDCIPQGSHLLGPEALWKLS